MTAIPTTFFRPDHLGPSTLTGLARSRAGGDGTCWRPSVMLKTLIVGLVAIVRGLIAAGIFPELVDAGAG